MKLKITTPANFNFRSTLYSHGWCSLSPFEVSRDRKRLLRTILSEDGKPFVVTIYEAHPGALIIETDGAGKSDWTPYHKELIAQATACLRLDEDLEEFYTEARRHPQFRWIPKLGAGRLLRAPEVFEDIIKMICTTNCSWALTETMVRNLCARLGTRVTETTYTFPTAEAIADRTEQYLRKEIRAGYRAPYILEFSRRVARGESDPQQWRKTTAPTPDLFNEVRSIKGVGPYAAGNILKLLGRYDYLGVDSWCRKQFSGLHKNGRRVSDRTIERYYAPYGNWRGLFFWLDLTKHWYRTQYPF